MSDIHVGKQIAQYRKQKQMTIKQLAEDSGVTSSLLSQIEKGNANPSLNTLKIIAKALDVPLFHFFMNDCEGEDLVVKANQRKKMIFPENKDLAYEMLSPDRNGAIEFMLMDLPSQSKSSEQPMSHKGEEVAFVIHGQVQLEMMNQLITLDQGDSVKIPPNTDHKWENNSNKDCQIIFAVTPPSF